MLAVKSTAAHQAKAEKLPKTLDWNAWLSAAPYHDFSKDLAYGEWRCWFDYGNGCMGDWGAHILDTIHRFTLQGDLPTEVKISNCTGHNPFVFPIQDTLTMTFPAKGRHGDVTLEWWEGLNNQTSETGGFLPMARGDGIDRTNARNMRLTETKITNAQRHNERDYGHLCGEKEMDLPR